MKLITTISLFTAALFATSCGHQQTTAKTPIQFEITDVKKDINTSSFGGANLEVRGVVRVHDDALKGRTVILLMKSKVSFKTSGITKEDKEDDVMVKDGSGLIDTTYYFSADDAKTIGGELSSANVSWEAVGYVDLQPASVKVQ